MDKVGKWLIILTFNMLPAFFWMISIFYMPSGTLPGPLVIFGIFSYPLSSIAPIPAIYFMFRWTTQYNLERFGYKSKGEWEDAQKLKNEDSIDPQKDESNSAPI